MSWTQVSAKIINANGDVVGVSNNGLDVSIQDQSSPIVNLYLHKDISGTYSINTNTTADTRTIIIDSTVAPVAGNIVCLKEGLRFYQATVLSFTGTNPYTLTVDSPLDYAFTTAALLHLGSKDIAVDGSTTTAIFAISPKAGVKWDLTRFEITLNTTAAPKDDYFGDTNVGVLTNGIILRQKDGGNYNVFNVKTNLDLQTNCNDLQYLDKASGFGVSAHRIFAGQENDGVVIRLDGDAADELQLLISDDLSSLVSGSSLIRGHVVVD